MALLFVVCASVLFGVAPTIQNLILEEGVSVYGLIAGYSTISVFTSLLFCKVSGASIKISKKQLKWLLTAGVCLFFTDFFLQTAYLYIPVGFTTMIHFTYPTVICVVGALIFKEKINLNKIIAIVCSILGMYFLVGGEFTGNIIGVPIAFSTALFYSTYLLILDKTEVSKVAEATRGFYCYCVLSTISICTTVVGKQAICTTPKQWALTFLVSIMLLAGIIMLNKGITKLSAGTVSFLNMIEPLTSFIVSTVVFGYALVFRNVIGCVLIVCSLIPIALNTSKQ